MITTPFACQHCADNDEIVAATHVISGMPLCEDHSVAECEEIIRHPSTFLHGWPTGEDRAEWGDAVPFFAIIEMVEAEAPLVPFTDWSEVG